MNKKGRILGVTTITSGYRMCLLKDVKKILEKESGRIIKDGDKIIFVINETGEIVIRIA